MADKTTDIVESAIEVLRIEGRRRHIIETQANKDDRICLEPDSDSDSTPGARRSGLAQMVAMAFDSRPDMAVLADTVSEN